MHHKLDTTRPRSRSRIALSVATAVTCLVTVTGCSDDGPKPEDQREQMVATTNAVVDKLTDRLELVGLVVLDDGSETVECPDGGVQYRYTAEGTTDDFASDEYSVDAVLSDVGAMIYGVLMDMPEVLPFTDIDDNWLDPDWNGQSVISYRAETGAEEDMRLVFELESDEEGVVEIRITGTTTCG